MADAAVNAISYNIEAIQISQNVVPGAVFPYQLPQGDVEEPFEPISSFSIRESGRYGPLNEDQLKTFLRHKLDRRIVCSKDVIQQYTANVTGLTLQLTNLRNRINQIKASEKERTDYLKKRIRDLEKALRENKPLPIYIPHELRLSNAAKEAFQHVGYQGPLAETQLFNFINNPGDIPQVPLNDFIKQLKDLRLRINDNVDIEKHKVKLPYDRVIKALNDILTEMMVI